MRTYAKAGAACVIWLGSLLGAAVSTQAQPTSLLLDSQPGDPVGGGTIHSFSPPAFTFNVWREDDNSIIARVANADYSHYWTIFLGAPNGAVLMPGTYAPAGVPAFQFLSRLTIFEGSGTCFYTTGRFQVLEVVYGVGGTIEKLAVDLEQHCDDAGPGLVAALRLNSTIGGLPFGGQYFQRSLTVTPPVHGSVAGDGIACGGGETACALTFGSATTFQLTATPDPGYVFTGWTGECRGGASTTVHVNSVKQCGATFGLESPTEARTLLAIYSAAGEYLAEGRTELYGTANSVSDAIVTQDRDALFMHLNALGLHGEAVWRIVLQAPVGQPLTTGSYPFAVGWAREFVPGLSVMTEFRSCDSGGRFEILEFAVAADGTVLRLAADIEHHCGTADPPLFMAIRYNSSVPGILPFGSITPQYELVVAPPAHGTITGGGLDCGGGGTACNATYTGPTSVSLTATAAPGYIFTGWTGACSGGASTVLLVNTVRSCGASFEPLIPGAPRTLFVVDSETGDPVGGGQDIAQTPSNATFSIGLTHYPGYSTPYYSSVIVHVQTLSTLWSLEFMAPQRAVPSVGTYAPATRAPSTPFNGLSVTGNGVGCNELTGRFVVLEATYAADGSVLSFAADVEQHCEDLTPGLFAAIRFNSAVPAVPFGGAYPRYEIAITPSAGGKVVGDGLSCGGGEVACGTTFGAATSLTLTALPDADHVFAGWGGGCSGARTTTINVNSVKTCAVLFVPLTPGARTLAYLDSSPGDKVGRGLHRAFSSINSVWTVATSATDSDGVNVRISADGQRSAVDWTFLFRAPLGSRLQPGTYSPVSRASFPTTLAGLEVYDHTGGCQSVVGSFTIHELTRNPQTGEITAFAIDFEQRCESMSGPPLSGTLRYNSAVGVPLRGAWLAGSVASPVRYNTSITWTATAFPDIGVEYAFWRYDQSKGWHNVQAYGPAPTYTWAPTSVDVGTHPLQVWMRRIGSTAPYDVWTGTTVTVEAGSPPVITALSYSSQPSMTVGSLITWTAVAGGGYPPLLYQFWRLDGNTWKMVRDYSQLSSYSWTPAAGDVGPHALQVWVRSGDSVAPYDAYRAMSFDVSQSDPVVITRLTANPAPPLAAGQTVTWTALATGGIAPLQYQFWRLDGSTWKLVQAYGPSPTYAWTPAMADAGAHALQVWVRGSGSSAAYDAWSAAEFSVGGPAPIKVTGLLPTLSTPLPAGTAITWTAAATGGTEPLQYQFWRLDGSSWKLVRDYAPSPVFVWTPGLSDVGDHALQVWVRSSGSTTAYEAWSTTSFAVAGPAPVNVTALTSTPALPFTAGAPVAWHAAATGGIAPLQYQFWRADADGWKMVQDYSISNTYTWTPGTADVGAHVVQVWVRSAGSTADYEAWMGTGIFNVLAPIVPPPGASPALAVMTQERPGQIAAALAEEQALLPRNPGIASFIDAKCRT